jgi:hypothetical protein
VSKNGKDYDLLDVPIVGSGMKRRFTWMMDGETKVRHSIE